MPDPFDLNRFVSAQDGSYVQALEELKRGEKRSHWIWYVFPQLRGLGFSSMSHRYGIDSIDEAQAYLQHPILGSRLRECVQVVIAINGRDIGEIFGGIDAMKFRSSMTLFTKAAPEETIFSEALEKYFAGELDPKTSEMLGD